MNSACAKALLASALLFALPASAATENGISDTAWAQIAGSRARDIYDVSRGDSLSGISKRLFGDADYWPKIWALNQRQVTNPHLIHPGLKVAFSPGSADSLPEVALVAEASGSDGAPAFVPDANPKGLFGLPAAPKGEWQRLPKQAWEYYPPKRRDASIDRLGFDRGNVAHIQRARGLELLTVAASEPYEPLGKILGSPRLANAYSITDTIYIEPQEGLQVGETYTIVGKDPRKVSFKDSGRTGFAYTNKAKVKIITIRDEVFVGIISESHDPVFRGDILVPVIDKVQDLDIIPGREALRVQIALDREWSSFATAQHKTVVIDAGTTDGVERGMVFRSYQYDDPITGKNLMNADLVITSDYWVVQASEKISIALVIDSVMPQDEQTSATLLTEIAQLRRVREMLSAKGVEAELDELDKLDRSDSIGREEYKTLRQLELWQGNPPPPKTILREDTPAEDAPAQDDLPPAEAAPVEQSPVEEPAPQTLPDPTVDPAASSGEDPVLPQQTAPEPESDVPPTPELDELDTLDVPEAT